MRAVQLVAIVIAAVLFAFAAGLAVADERGGEYISTEGHAGEVYVADTGEWVDKNDHKAHGSG